MLHLPTSLALATFTARRLAPLDYVVLAVYFALNLGIGMAMSRRRQTSDSFFRGNHRVAWWAAAVSFMAAGASSISFMAIPAATYSSNWLSFGSAPAQGLAGMVAAFVFIGIMRRLDATTVFAFLERRFDRRVRMCGAAAAALLKICARMSVVMLLPSLALSTVTGLNVFASILVMSAITIFYSIEGGFMAVIWTDVMQSVVTLGGMIVAVAFVCHAVPGGLAGVIHSGEERGKFHLLDLSWNFTRPTLWVFFGMAWATVFTQIADQPYMQRVFATRDVATARRTMVWGNVLALTTGILFFFAGTTLWVFYHYHPDRLAAGLPPDKIVPFFIVNELPVGVVGLIIAALFAASMGTLSSTMNATAAVFLNDFYVPLRPHSTEKQRLRFAKLGTLAAGIAATAVALYLATLHNQTLWSVYLKLIATIGGGFAGIFGLGLMTRRANAPGVMIGLVASVAVTLLVMGTVTEFFTAFVAVTTAMVVGYGFSLGLARWAPRVDLTGLTLWDLRRDGPLG